MVNAVGLPCDCVDNCTDDAHKCERTICVMTTTTTSESATKYDKGEGDDSTELTDMMGSTDADVVFDNDSTVASDISDFETNQSVHNELKIEKASSWYAVSIQYDEAINT